MGVLGSCLERVRSKLRACAERGQREPAGSVPSLLWQILTPVKGDLQKSLYLSQSRRHSTPLMGMYGDLGEERGGAILGCQN